MPYKRIDDLVTSASTGLYGKQEVIRLAVLAALSGNNVFMYGPPGVAKTMLARRVAMIFQSPSFFNYLLGRFTTPEEIFGPLSIARLKDDDRYERIVEGYLPTADVAFLDEMWNASSAVLNSLLTAVNEKTYRNGREELHVPLKTVIGAGSDLPTGDEALANLWDRFLLRIQVHPVSDRSAFLELIQDRTDEHTDPVPDQLKVTPDVYDEWQDGIDRVEVPTDVLELIADVRERIERHNSMLTDSDPAGPIRVSDRRWKQAVRLLQAAAFFNDCPEVGAIECALLRHCLWWNRGHVEHINTIVQEALRRYARSGAFDPEEVRDEIEVALNRYIDQTTQAEERVEMVPIAVRGEYYRIADFDDAESALVWIGDYERLSDEEAQPTELFFYDGDEFISSRSVHAQRTSSAEIQIDGTSYRLLSEQRRKTSRIPRAVDETARAELLAPVAMVQTKVAAHIQRARSYRDQVATEAVRHLFVARRYADVLTTSLDQTIDELEALSADISDKLADR